MSRKRKPRAETLNNRLSDVSFTLAGINGGTGGSYLSSYNTWGFSNNYSLITLNRIILTYMFTGNGIFQTAIQLPIQDAIGKGIEIESGELDNQDIDDIYDYWEELQLWNTILNFMTWVRLFGGGAILINSNQKPDKPLSFKNLDKTPIEFYDLDRWQLDTNIAIYDDWDSYISSVEQGNGIIHLYGEPIHESRFLRGQGKRAPHYVRRQLRGWGMSEGERMIRDLNLYLKTQDATFELIDEAKVDIYKINGLANKLLTAGGTSAITARIQAANEIKNYVNALVLDSQEDYEQKTINFTGLAEMMNQNRMGVAAALRMPMTKLFGLSASGFNTGESDLENYNMMVESEVRAQLKPIIRTLLKVTMAHIFGYVPDFTFKFPSLREMTPEVEQTVKTQETNRLLAIYDRGLIDSQEFMQSIRKAGVVQIETKTEQGLNPNPEPPEPSGQTGSGLSTSSPTIGKETTKANSQKKKIKNEAAFDESKHPRDEAGKFGKGGGGVSKDETKKKVHEIISDYKDFTKTEFGYLDSVLTSDETESIGRYTTGGYEMNKDLRAGKENFYAKDIKGAFKKVKPLSKDIKLFRGLSVTNEFLDQLKSSEYITDKAFTSLTSDPGSALSFFTKAARGENEQKVILRVDVPKGSKVLDMQNSIEKEFLIDTGAKFKMGKIQKSDDNKFYIMDVTYEQ